MMGSVPNDELAESWDEGARAMMNAIGDAHGTISFIAPHNPYRTSEAVHDG